MKKTIKLTALILSILCILLFAACGKAEEKEKEESAVSETEIADDRTVEEIEKELGVSYDNVIIQYSMIPGFIQDPSENFWTNITVYADNTVQLWTSGKLRYDEESIMLQCDEKFKITEEQKQRLIKSIRGNDVIKLGKCSDPDVLDGSVEYMYLFDAEGSIVYKCGGSNPWTNESFSKVSDMVRNMTDRKAIDDIGERTKPAAVKTAMFISFEKKICTVINNPISGKLWIEYTIYPDNRMEVVGYTSRNPEENLLADMEPVTVELTDEQMKAIKNGIGMNVTDYYERARDNSGSNGKLDPTVIPYGYSDGYYIDTAVQFYDSLGNEEYFCYGYNEVAGFTWGTLPYDVFGMKEYLSYESKFCQAYYDKLGEDIDLENTMFYYTEEPYTKNKKGERIAVKYTFSAKNQGIKVSIGSVDDVKGERDIVSKEYECHGYFYDRLWKTYFYGVHDQGTRDDGYKASKPDYENAGTHISYFGKDGNIIGHIPQDKESLDWIFESINEDLSYAVPAENIEELKAEAEKLMK